MLSTPTQLYKWLVTLLEALLYRLADVAATKARKKDKVSA